MLLERNIVKRILLIKLRHFGDVLLTTPVLSTLKANYPDALIDILVYKETEQMLVCNQAVNEIYTIDRTLKKQGILAQLKGERELIKKLGRQHYNLVVNLADHARTAIYCKLLKPDFCIGFVHPKRNNWLWKSSHDVLVSGEKYFEQHVVLHNLSILQPLQLPELSTRVSMAYCEQDEKWLADFLKDNKLADYTVLQPTARWAFKTWSVQAFSVLIDLLTARGEKVVLTGGKGSEEIAMVDEIVKLCQQPAGIFNLAGQLELTRLAAVIDKAKLFIGVDSAPMHMAAALQTPAVVLFGPTNLKQWYPWQAPHTLIWAGDYRELPDFMQVDTATSERYLESIPVADVFAAVEEWLNKK